MYVLLSYFGEEKRKKKQKKKSLGGDHEVTRLNVCGQEKGRGIE